MHIGRQPYLFDTWKIFHVGDCLYCSVVSPTKRIEHKFKFIKKKVAFLYSVYKYICESKRKRRRYWVHPFNNARYLKGAFNTILIDLREDEQKVFNYFRMSI